MPRRIVVISAGLSTPSSTRLLADRLATATTDALVRQGEQSTVEVVELREHARDLADHLVAGFPNAALRPVLESVEQADAVIAVTPIFSASYSGLFKTFADVLDREAVTGTPVLVAATGGTARHSLALEHAMRPLFAYLRAAVVPTAVFAAPEDWGASDTTTSLEDRVERAAGELAAAVAARPLRARTDEFDDVPDFTALLKG
ncbi:CE1759 family FMN reductase [Pseudonocardia parietis]|uniref:FMN reductase n=1 Tax=Pseudonocardia parietis TaxID=570936 RepID=A0ABS4VNC5_9PSEU|nr:CE1759 family FMN reductase [Pseudonocardia parietis]MBP2365419.1 FMN reductase [Pseudonocardia parietis]